MEMLHTLLVVVATSKVIVYVCQNSQDYTFKGCCYYMQIIPQVSLKKKGEKNFGNVNRRNCFSQTSVD